VSRDPEGIARLIADAQRIALCSHINPDGDTLGASAAMRLALLQMGKQAEAFVEGKVPDNLAFLPGADRFRLPGDGEGPFDLMLSLDVSDLRRLGACEKLISVSSHYAQIDHHSSNNICAEVNSLDGGASSTCVMIREQLRVLGVPLNQDIAICLYAGISTDTGNFSYACTDAETFGVMAELADCGLPLSKLNRILFCERDRAQVMLIGRALASLQYHADGAIASIMLRRTDFEACNALEEHADTIVNLGLNTVGTRMAVMGRETPDGKVKLSLRSKEPDRIDEIARQFGGGGHAQASGVTMYCSLDEAVNCVIKAMTEKLIEEK